MPEDTQFKKEVQHRKKDYQDKKIELISRLCSEKPMDINKKELLKK